jgi:hypothetical protein
MKTKMSRVMFCQKCFDEQRPHDGMLFAVLGTKNNKVWVHYYEAPYKRELIKPYGFTPHFVVLDKVVDNKAHILISCGCDKCDVDIRHTQENGWKIDIVKTTPIIINLNDYLAMETFTDTGFKL